MMSINPDVKNRFQLLQLGVLSGKHAAVLAPLLSALKIKYVSPKEIEAPDWFIMGCECESRENCENGTIYINPERLMSISIEDAAFVLEHELWHIARDHNKRVGNRDPWLWNIACDHVINLAMLAEGASCSLRGQADPKFKNMTEEEVYAILEKEKLKQNSSVIRSAA